MYKNVKLQLEQSSYKSHPNYLISDHKPVTSEFAIRVSGSFWFVLFVVVLRRREFLVVKVGLLIAL